MSDQNLGGHQTVCRVPHLAVFNFKGGGEGVVCRVCSVAQGHRLCKASAHTRWVSASLATCSLPPHWQPTSCVELDSKRGTTMPLERHHADKARGDGHHKALLDGSAGVGVASKGRRVATSRAVWLPVVAVRAHKEPKLGHPLACEETTGRVRQAGDTYMVCRGCLPSPASTPCVAMPSIVIGALNKRTDK